MKQEQSFSDKGSELLLRYEQSLDCVHCGLCLPRCPTYEQTGDETESPRGRIYLMRAVSEGRLSVTTGFATAMENCLVCRACEEVCPSGVAFGHMMEITREELVAHHLTLGRFKRWCIRTLIPSRRLTRALTFAVRIYQLTGVPWIMQRLHIATRMHRSLPSLPPRKTCRALPLLTHHDAGTEHRGSVVFLEGCVMPTLMGDVNHATVEALASAGFDVHVPQEQTCCGALASHSGDTDTARQLARQNINGLMAVMPDHVVVNASGCGAALHGYPNLVKEDSNQLPIATALETKLIDVIALLQRVGHTPKGPVKPVVAAYDEPCHLINVGSDADDVRSWIDSIPNIELVPLPGCNDCCGAAGIYSLTRPEMSDAILESKLNQLEATGAKLLLTGNIGCILQWRRGIANRGLDIKVLHPISLAR